MRVIMGRIQDFEFEYKQVDEQLKKSIDRIGLAIPIHVKIQEGQMICMDGNKRLSAITDLLKVNPNHPKLQAIPMIVSNSMDLRSNYSWGSKNYH